MRDIVRSEKGATDAAAQKAAGTVEAPDKPEYQEIKEGTKSNYARLYKRLTKGRR